MKHRADISELRPRIQLAMKGLALLLVTVLLATAFSFAAEDVKTAKVLSVKAYDHGRIAFWEGRVPIYHGYPFCDITLTLDQKKYVVRYESLTGYFPSKWKAGRDVQVRMGKGKIFLFNAKRKLPPRSITGICRTACPQAGGRP